MNRTEINIEMHKRTIIRFGGKRLSAFSEKCGRPASALTHEQVGEFFSITIGEVICRLEEDEIHRVTGGLPLVCGNSLGNENKPSINL